MSARKVRLIIGLIRGMDVAPALAQLSYYSKAASRPVTKLIKSAVANAEHNFKLDADNLYIKQIYADAGPVLDRWRARAFGRAAPIRKRSCHITVVLDERRVSAPKGAAAAVVKKSAKAAVAAKETKVEPKTAAKKTVKAKKKE